MHVSSQEPPVVRSFAHKLYLAGASLILIGIVSEGVLIGPSLFADAYLGDVQKQSVSLTARICKGSMARFPQDQWESRTGSAHVCQQESFHSRHVCDTWDLSCDLLSLCERD